MHCLLGLREDDFPLVLQQLFFDLRALPDKSFEEEDDFPLVLQQLFFDLRALPDKSFEEHEESLIVEMWKVTWKGNWDRIEMFSAHLDAELRVANGQPRTKDHPGIITESMVQRVIAKMRPHGSK